MENGTKLGVTFEPQKFKFSVIRLMLHVNGNGDSAFLVSLHIQKQIYDKRLFHMDTDMKLLVMTP